jgi:hypothetical protein
MGLHGARPHQFSQSLLGLRRSTTAMDTSLHRAFSEFAGLHRDTRTSSAQRKLGFLQDYHGLGQVITEGT